MTKRDKAPSSQDVPALVEGFTNQPKLSGSPKGEFTAILANQVASALFTGAGTSGDLVAVMQEASFTAMRGVAPTDPVEGMFAAQMVAIHNAAMDCLRRAALAEQTFEGRRTALDFANKLVRSYAVLAEALSRHRGKGQQVVRVEHVTVNAGGQAVVGSIASTGGGYGRGSDERSHAKALAHAPEPALRGADTERKPLPLTRGAREMPL